MNKTIIGVSLFSFSVLFSATTFAQTTPDYAALIEQAHQKFKSNHDGKVADYIPALATYSPKNFAITIATVDGKIYQVGDVNKPFPMESLSKVFTMALAMEQHGPQVVLDKLGANATGMPFNSGLAVELTKGAPENPLVNAGAMSTVSLIEAKDKTDRWNKILNNLNVWADATLTVNEPVFKSEMETNQHNQALAKLMESYNSFYGNTEEAVEIYTRQCSVDITVEQLAKMGAVLANKGKSPFNGRQLLNEKYVPQVLAEMAIAGLYDGSGKWLYTVGIPAKSGVGGGMVAVVPGEYAIAVYSPPLDEAGNSVRAQKTIEYVADATKANVFLAK
ncbi:glutaminase A [Salmonella enterica]|uniref:glutaminase A n=1 Tax=Salmonella enterica TaxID=28901 RepID=UPI000B8B7C97|nr:glutaminase A [Salmonella enterica]EAW1963461.1 glutaminase [Salmonella enterica subsp. enterica]ECA4081969.1 glutaminase [Salmonella enterica subsp. enterica serovar Texas]EDP9254089.1 glutaminase A [Salmonella enterica subsp. enterica serovar Newmexico]EDU3495027.1 glutaminase A [Salmonella enterica subsp. enterica serovar Brazos]EDU6322757.1 glutaminase A [Salmonella enterica subsp. enterica serovar Edinburgh]EDX2436396.1 glutaminase A [Salmonella enterica subsp. enterica serovar Koenig